MDVNFFFFFLTRKIKSADAETNLPYVKQISWISISNFWAIFAPFSYLRSLLALWVFSWVDKHCIYISTTKTIYFFRFIFAISTFVPLGISCSNMYLNRKLKPKYVYFLSHCSHHNHKKWKNSLESSPDRVLFTAELEFPKILVPRLPPHISDGNIECGGTLEFSK